MNGSPMPVMIHASTPSYQGSHIDGFHGAVRAAVETLAEQGTPQQLVNLFPNMVHRQIFVISGKFLTTSASPA